MCFRTRAQWETQTFNALEDAHSAYKHFGKAKILCPAELISAGHKF